jgi:hypothetical protein
VSRAPAILSRIVPTDDGEDSIQSRLGYSEPLGKFGRGFQCEIDFYLLWHRYSPFKLYAGVSESRFLDSARNDNGELNLTTLWNAQQVPSLQQPPGFAILLKAASVGRSAGIEVEAPERREGSDRDDKPRVLGDDING